jgi:hypothetical protein
LRRCVRMTGHLAADPNELVHAVAVLLPGPLLVDGARNFFEEVRDLQQNASGFPIPPRRKLWSAPAINEGALEPNPDFLPRRIAGNPSFSPLSSGSLMVLRPRSVRSRGAVFL